MRSLLAIVIGACFLILSNLPGWAERGIVVGQDQGSRVALIIGNADYKSAPLQNPVNDARDISSMLRGLGFEVIIMINARQRKMVAAIDDFYKRLQKTKVGLFYYAGHGMQIEGRNYLIPVDAHVTSKSDVKFESVDAGRILGKMKDAGNELNLIILDACRNNPFQRSFRTNSQGLAKMEAPRGSLVAYATAPGSVAAEGRGRNGVYTRHLLQHMGKPGWNIEKVLKETRKDVYETTKGKQLPWDSSSLMGDFYFVAGGSDMPSTQTAPAQPEAKTGSLLIWTEPKGAEVFIKRKRQGTAPIKVSGLKPDQYQVEARLEGYVKASRAVSVPPGKTNKITLQLEPITHLGSMEDDNPGDLSQITFTDVRQYLVDNEKIGRLLVIEGKAVNESRLPVEMIKIQSAIFAENGKALQRKAFYCGNTLSLFQLQVLDQAEMESALQSKVGILTNNSNLGPEQEVPFMTVFFNPPESMAEFSLKVIKATPLNHAPKVGHLYVTPTPSDARVRIMNIVPPYEDGMELKPGEYHIRVDKSGYETEDRWVDIVAGEKLEEGIELPKIQSGPLPGEPWTDPVVGLEFVWVPGGCYEMGQTESEKEYLFKYAGQETYEKYYDDELPRHEVCVDGLGCYEMRSNEGQSDEKPVHEVCVDGFWMGKTEVTQGQWEKIMGSNPSRFDRGSNYPVETVSWNDCQDYIKKLNRRNSGNLEYRLPSEAEWEYAARSGGKREKYAGGSDVDKVAWYGGNSGGRTHHVGTKSANGLSLYDMSGNVWEWCLDVYDDGAYSRHSKNNPVITSGGSYRVFRGGSWLYTPRNVRAASRYGDDPDVADGNLGFRLCFPRVR